MKTNRALWIVLLLVISSSVPAQQVRPRQRPERNLPRQEKWDESKEQDIRDILKEKNIVDMAFLDSLKTNNSLQYKHFMMKNWAEIQKLERIKTIAPELYERGLQKARLNGECWELAWKYRNSDESDETEALRTELKEKLGQLFDLRETEKQERIEKLEEELEKLKEMVQERQENREEIIERRLNDMLNEKDELSW